MKALSVFANLGSYFRVDLNCKLLYSPQDTLDCLIVMAHRLAHSSCRRTTLFLTMSAYVSRLPVASSTLTLSRDDAVSDR